MTWTTPKTYTDSSILTHSDVNALNANMEVLYAPDKYYFTLGKPVVTVSSAFSGQEASFLVDGTTSPWRTNNIIPGWCKFDFQGSPQAVQKYVLTGHTNTAHTATAFTFEGSDDDTNWDILDTQSSLSWTASEVKTFTITNTTKYRYYRIYCTASSGGTAVGFGEAEFYLDSSTTLTLLGNSDHTTSSTTFVTISDEFDVTLTDTQGAPILIKFYASVKNDTAFDVYINSTSYFSSASSSGAGFVEVVNTALYNVINMTCLLTGYSGSVNIKIVWRKTGSSDPAMDTNNSVRFLAACL